MRTLTIPKIVLSITFFTSAVMAQTVQVGTCLAHLKSYQSISQAVSSVPAYSTVLVCPGEYPEQVTITQPLTLRGVKIGNAANPTITVPTGGLTQSVISPVNSARMFFQVLVLNTESEGVTINDLAVNGSSAANASLNGWMDGIYYQNSSGRVSGVATFGQVGNGYGFGIFFDNTSSTAKTVTVQHNSIHDFDAEGIRSNGSPTPTLTLSIKSNSVIGSNTGNNAVYNGIDLQGSVGSVSDNFVAIPPGVATNGIGIYVTSNTTVSSNTVENWAIFAGGDSNLVEENKLSLSRITILGNNNIVRGNSLFDGSGISLTCQASGNSIANNVINNVDIGINGVNSSDIVGPNSISNTATVSTTCN
jgi:hypothetical protein